jgi:uncharacterized protein (TIGR02246 family)
VTARTPEDLDRLFAEALNSANLDALVALYEPQAALTPMPDKLVSGSAAIRESLAGFLAGKPHITLTPRLVAQSGDVAVVSAKWELSINGPDGKPTKMTGQSVEVLRRQGDGRWLFAIDLPFGVGG